MKALGGVFSFSSRVRNWGGCLGTPQPGGLNTDAYLLTVLEVQDRGAVGSVTGDAFSWHAVGGLLSVSTAGPFSVHLERGSSSSKDAGPIGLGPHPHDLT